MALEFVRLTLAAADQSEVAAAMTAFDCCRGVTDDVVAHEVNEFIRTDERRRGVEWEANTTYLFFDEELLPGRIVGYVTLAMDVVRLSEGERERLNRPNFPAFGALRLVMIGVESGCQRRGLGEALLQWTLGKGRALAAEVAFRFLIADVNIKRKSWYDERGFVVNRAATYQRKGETVSMRRDLQEHAE